MLTKEEIQALLEYGVFGDENIYGHADGLARTVIALHQQLADAKAAQALDRYLRLRPAHKLAADSESFSGIGFYARPKPGSNAEAIVVFVGVTAATDVTSLIAVTGAASSPILPIGSATACKPPVILKPSFCASCALLPSSGWPSSGK